MSYCRFSTNDHACDVYVYESDAGWVTHVAARRYAFTDAMPPAVDVEPWHPTWAPKFAARLERVRELLDAASLEPIGGPHDGETFTRDSSGECADLLEGLAWDGYRVPNNVVHDLREERVDRGAT